jgi:hypothetical protein
MAAVKERIPVPFGNSIHDGLPQESYRIEVGIISFDGSLDLILSSNIIGGYSDQMIGKVSNLDIPPIVYGRA